MFINCTANKLTPKQLASVQELASDVLELSEIQKDLYEELLNCPTELDEINDLLQEFSSFLLEWQDKREGKELYLHFPIGSPYFMALFFCQFPKDTRIIFLFSHSIEKSVEEIQTDGSIVIKTVLEFQKFLEL
ncbi:MAG: hypothetical protein AAF518_21225 [Spirochaetota bacterium]